MIRQWFSRLVAAMLVGTLMVMAGAMATAQEGANPPDGREVQFHYTALPVDSTVDSKLAIDVRGNLDFSWNGQRMQAPDAPPDAPPDAQWKADSMRLTIDGTMRSRVASHYYDELKEVLVDARNMRFQLTAADRDNMQGNQPESKLLGFEWGTMEDTTVDFMPEKKEWWQFDFGPSFIEQTVRSPMVYGSLKGILPNRPMRVGETIDLPADLLSEGPPEPGKTREAKPGEQMAKLKLTGTRNENGRETAVFEIVYDIDSVENGNRTTGKLAGEMLVDLKTAMVVRYAVSGDINGTRASGEKEKMASISITLTNKISGPGESTERGQDPRGGQQEAEGGDNR